MAVKNSLNMVKFKSGYCIPVNNDQSWIYNIHDFTEFEFQ